MELNERVESTVQWLEMRASWLDLGVKGYSPT